MNRMCGEQVIRNCRYSLIIMCLLPRYYNPVLQVSTQPVANADTPRNSGPMKRVQNSALIQIFLAIWPGYTRILRKWAVQSPQGRATRSVPQKGSSRTSTASTDRGTMTCNGVSRHDCVQGHKCKSLSVPVRAVRESKNPIRFFKPDSWAV